MLGFLKKTTNPEAVAHDMAVILGAIYTTLNQGFTARGLEQNLCKGYTVGFTYVIGNAAIQESQFSTAEKHRLSVAFIRAWQAQLGGKGELTQYLQDAHAEYRDGLAEERRGVSLANKLAYVLTTLMETEDPAYLGGAIYAASDGLQGLGGFLKDVRKEFRLA
jgi:hypothetical protein